VAYKVVALNPHPDDALEEENAILRAAGVPIERARVHTDAEILAVAADADVVAPMGARLTGEVIRQLRACRLIPSGGIGFDHIDAEAATERGILVTNMAETFVEEVANHTWLLLLMVARRGLWLHEMATTNRWDEANARLFPILKIPMPRITGQTLGLVPFGRIPRAVARRARAFGMEVLAYDPYVPAEVFAQDGVRRATLDQVFAEADVVSCHLPLSTQTYHLIGDGQFRRMKPSAYFLNTGRGKVVDELALIAALRDGRIAGAGLDVLEQEPPEPDNPLLHLPNVVVTPHMASVSDVSEVQRRRLLAHQILDALSGKVPHGVVNPAAIERWPYRA
jgi:D-3-phosphoglycerate dehydrogenase